MQRPFIIDKLTAQLVRHEGLKLSAYLDSMGILTIGIGHNCRAIPVPGICKVGDKITREKALELFDIDISRAEADLLRRWPWMWNLDDARYGAMLNMIFNMGGNTLAQFIRSLGLMQVGQYKQAAAAMLKSAWAAQVGCHAPGSAAALKLGRPGRAWEVTEQIRTGLWQGV